MHAALKLQCGRVTGNKKSTIGGFINSYYTKTIIQLLIHSSTIGEVQSSQR